MPVAVPLAIVGASAVGAIATSSAASKAASAQTAAANQANQTQKDFYNQTRADLAPYRDQGAQAYGTLNQLLGVGGNSDTMQSTLEGLPGYQFTLGQGLKSTQNGFAARGLADSGGALKGAATYSTGLANAQYGNYVNQLQNSANTGESAAAQTSQAGTQTGQGIASNTIGAGNAQAAASNATGNALANAANSGLGGYLYSLNNGLINGNNNQNAPVAGWYSGNGNGEW